MSLPVVRRFVQSVSDQAVGVGVIRGVKPDQQLVKVRSAELMFLKSTPLATFKYLSLSFYLVFNMFLCTEVFITRLTLNK